ncbi:hypothetical protein INR49_006759 [Caranx melampygus]|nr:hypothetical protein INR49_006759 [Caranx melampygus]
MESVGSEPKCGSYVIPIPASSETSADGPEQQNRLDMADVSAVDEEPKQDETTASVKSEPDEASEETPNGVKT